MGEFGGLNDIVSLCFEMHQAGGRAQIPQSKLSIVVGLDNAKRIREDAVSVANGRQTVEIAWTRRPYHVTQVESATVPVPNEPELGQEWFTCFGIRVYAVNC